ncbi:SA1362 family protein [Bacillus sp. 03113]|uniref:SA1362 family protein n=1 Tax=Bacillus sp. 03113 TaxID=2578211 RepID=UPI002852E317|nr:SA1362 family protein [Bacillus sp. 03113]
MAFLKNRISFYVVCGLIALGIFGIVSTFISDPAGFLKSLAVIIVVGVILFLIFRRFYQPNPERKEQRAFVKAAKRSKKRYQHREPGISQKSNSSSISSIKKRKPKKKQSSTHLTVIDGKKGKKKNRASF